MNNASVYFYPISPKSNLTERITAMGTIVQQDIFEKTIDKKDRIGIKTHVGEVHNTTHISPDIIKVIVQQTKKLNALPFITETSTLYAGPRSNAVQHILHAYEHGFSIEKVGAPFIMADGLMGNSELSVSIPGKLYSTVNIARDAVLCDSMIVVSHPTGHIVAGIGAAIKNLGMGLSSRKGKLQQHSSVKPSIVSSKCTFCKHCIKACPVQAITKKDKKAYIDEEKCIGCGECIAECNFNAVHFNYGVQSVELQKRMAEYALGSVISKPDKFLFINALIDMTSQCDCMAIKQYPLIPDVGILLSNDPVAIDQATLDLTKEMNGEDLGTMSQKHLNPEIQLEHAEDIGLGTRKYDLIYVND